MYVCYVGLLYELVILLNEPHLVYYVLIKSLESLLHVAINSQRCVTIWNICF